MPIRFDDDEEALRGAVLDGLGPLVRFLLDEGVEAKPLSPEDPPLVAEAAASGHAEVVRIFAEKGASLEGTLVMATERLYGPDDDESLPPDLADLLVDRCDVNEKDDRGRTPRKRRSPPARDR